MPRLSEETFGAGDMTWLESSHGIWECRTEVLDISAFTAATHYPDGYIKSGTPLAKVSGLMVPYTSAEATTTGAGVLAGHLLTDQPVVPASGVGAVDFAVPVLDHGRVKASKVPQGTDAFTKPVAAAKRIDVTIVYV